MRLIVVSGHAGRLWHVGEASVLGLETWGDASKWESLLVAEAGKIYAVAVKNAVPLATRQQVQTPARAAVLSVADCKPRQPDECEMEALTGVVANHIACNFTSCYLYRD